MNTATKMQKAFTELLQLIAEGVEFPDALDSVILKYDLPGSKYRALTRWYDDEQAGY